MLVSSELFLLNLYFSTNLKPQLFLRLNCFCFIADERTNKPVFYYEKAVQAQAFAYKLSYIVLSFHCLLRFANVK